MNKRNQRHVLGVAICGMGVIVLIGIIMVATSPCRTIDCILEEMRSEPNVGRSVENVLAASHHVEPEEFVERYDGKIPADENVNERILLISGYWAGVEQLEDEVLTIAKSLYSDTGHGTSQAGFAASVLSKKGIEVRSPNNKSQD